MAAHWTSSWTSRADDILAFWAMMISEFLFQKLIEKITEKLSKTSEKQTLQHRRDHCDVIFSRPSFFGKILRRI